MDFVEIGRRLKQPLWFLMVFALLVFALVVVSYYFLGTRFASPTFRAKIGSNSDITRAASIDQELAEILERASTTEKTVILTNLNKAWAEPGSVFDLMLESFRIGNNTKRLVKHLVVVSFDEKAHSRCLSLNLHCYFLKVQGFNFSRDVGYMTSNYMEMVWRKIDFLHLVLSLGYNFLFSDNDILWLRDPFPNLQDGDVDFHVSSDKYNGNPNDFTNGPNTGIMYVKSNIRTILLFKFWYYSRSMYEGKNDQEVFNKIKKRSFLFKMIGLKAKFLDPTLFGSFCQPSKDFNKVCTMHASCCVGLSHKVHDLKLILDDWRKYSPASPQTLPHPFQWSAPQNCSF